MISLDPHLIHVPSRMYSLSHQSCVGWCLRSRHFWTISRKDCFALFKWQHCYKPNIQRRKRIDVLAIGTRNSKIAPSRVYPYQSNDGVVTSTNKKVGPCFQFLGGSPRALVSVSEKSTPDGAIFKISLLELGYDEQYR